VRKFVQVALENMMNRTSIVIASPFNYSKADTIIVMQKEKLEQEVDELIALNGMYNKLVTLQSFE
jgi:subfamily B ATP-binding cassette protein MsbA